MTERTHAGGSRASTGPGADAGTAAGEVPIELTVVSDLWQRARYRLTGPDLAAAVIVLVQLAAVLSLVVPGSLYGTDLQAQGGAFGRSFHEYVRLGQGAVDPAALPRMTHWALAQWFPLDHTPVVLITLAIRLLLGVVAWSLLRQLFGARPLALVPLAILLLSPALVPATAWFSLAIGGLTCTVGLLWAIDGGLRWMSRPAWYRLFSPVAGSALAVLSSPRGVIAPLLVVLACLVVHATRARPGFGPSASGVTGVLLRTLPVSLGTLAAVVAVLAWYDQPPGDGGDGGPAIADLALAATFRTTLPALFGGPWSWRAQDLYYGTSDVQLVAAALCCLVAAAAVARWAVLRPAETARAGLLAVGWLVAVFLLAARQAGVAAVPAPSADLGLWPDVATALVLAGAMAAIPWRIGARQSDRPVFDEQSGQWLVVSSPMPTGPRRPTGLTALLGLVMALVVAVLSVGSWTSFSRLWWSSPTGTWLAFMSDSVRTAEVYPRIAPLPVPPAVLPMRFQYGLPVDAPLIGLLRPDARFSDGDGPVRGLDGGGTLRRMQALPVTVSLQGLCPFSPDGSTGVATVPLIAPSKPGFATLVEVGALMPQASTMQIVLQTTQGTFVTPQRWSDETLPAGPHTVRVPVPPTVGVAAVLIRTPTGPKTCITGVRVVRFVP